MSNVSRGSSIEARRMARRKDEIARDLETLVQRLAESREAIVQLLTAVAREDGAVALEPPRSSVTPLRALRSTDGTHGAEMAVGPGTSPQPAPEMQARECSPGDAAEGMQAAQGAQVAKNGIGEDGQAWERFVNAGEALGIADADARGTRAARRMIWAAVLVAVGAVVVLTTLVSLL